TVVEETAGAGLRQTEQRHLTERAAIVRCRFAEAEEGADLGARGFQNLGDAFGRGPARATIGAGAFRFVEGGCVETRAPGNTRCRELVALGEVVERRPNS